MRFVSAEESARRLATLTIAKATVDLTQYGYDPVGALLDRCYVDGVLSKNELLEITLTRYRHNWSQPPAAGAN
jgi:hypothetical protein